jgi:hypothetical protein
MKNSTNIGITFWERFTLVVVDFKSAAEVARRIGAPGSTVGGWTKGNTIPDPQYFKALQKEYKLSDKQMCYLHYGDGPPPAETKTALPSREGGPEKPYSGRSKVG